MFLSYAFRTAPAVVLVTLGAAAAAVDYRSTVSAQGQGSPAAPTDLRATVSNSNVNLSWRPGQGSQPEDVHPRGRQPRRRGRPGRGADDHHQVRSRRTRPMASTSCVSKPATAMATAGRPTRCRCASAAAHRQRRRPACVTNVSGTNVGVAWTGSVGATSYVLEIGLASGAVNLGSTPVNGTTLAAANVPNGIYYLRVKATNRCSTNGALERSDSRGRRRRTDCPHAARASRRAAISGIVDALNSSACAQRRRTTSGWWMAETATRTGPGIRRPTRPAASTATSTATTRPRCSSPRLPASPVRFGYIGRRHPMPGEPNGHEEAHEGFKCSSPTPAR